MPDFPRTTVGDASLSRMIIGTNWFLGWSHTSKAKDNFIKSYQTRENIAEILTVFFSAGIDTVMGMPLPILREAISDAEDRTGREAKRVITPHFNFLPGGPPESEPERVFDQCKEFGATVCMPHQCVTDRIIDRMHNTIRDIDQDMITIGTTTPDEAKEVIDLSLDFLERRLPGNELQTTRSKKSLTEESA